MSLEYVPDTERPTRRPTGRPTGLVLDEPGHPYDGTAEPLLSTLRAGPETQASTTGRPMTMWKTRSRAA